MATETLTPILKDGAEGMLSAKANNDRFIYKRLKIFEAYFTRGSARNPHWFKPHPGAGSIAALAVLPLKM